MRPDRIAKLEVDPAHGERRALKEMVMSYRYIIDGMKSMLKDGTITPDMGFREVQDRCDEPDLHEVEDLDVMTQCLDEAKTEFRREMMPLRVAMRPPHEA